MSPRLGDKREAGGLTTEEDVELDRLEDERQFIAAESERREAPVAVVAARDEPAAPPLASPAPPAPPVPPPPPPPPPPMPDEFKIGGRVRYLSGPPIPGHGRYAPTRDGRVVGWKIATGEGTAAAIGALEVLLDGDREPTLCLPSRAAPLDAFGRPVEGTWDRCTWHHGCPPPQSIGPGVKWHETAPPLTSPGGAISPPYKGFV